MPPTPKVFISYSHDAEAHKTWVLKLATDLMSNGIDVTLDKWDLSPGQDIVAFMTQGIAASDRVLMVCSQKYVEKADERAGGVGYEGLIVTGELVQNVDTKKFVPLIRSNDAPQKMPTYLGARKYVDFSEDANYDRSLSELVHDIHGRQLSAKPPLGPNPFSGTPTTTSEPPRAVGPSGLTPKGELVLADEWFTAQATRATAGLTKLALKGSMELRFALHAPVSKSQVELLNAVRAAEIHTFGWPIAVTLDNRPEFRPKPTVEGIVAEISPEKGEVSSKRSYDYWSARTNGDFYLLQSLFEDERGTDLVFADTRIVRVTEAFLFMVGFYEKLGVTNDVKVSARVTHRGLAGRTLKAASPRRYLHPATAEADVSQSQVTDFVGDFRQKLVEHVTQVVAPMLMLFEFKTLDRKVYEEIVTAFVNGKVV